MSLISELSQPYAPPVYAEILSLFSRGNIADKIGLSYGLTSNILSGCRKASPRIEKKLIALAAGIEAEMKQQEV